MGSNTQQRYSAKNTAIAATILIFPAYILFMISQYWVNIPYWDAWGSTLSLAHNMFQHHLSFLDFWRAHNSHRIVLTKLIYLFDYRFLAGNRLPLLLMQIAIQACTWTLLIIQLRKLISPHTLQYKLLLIAFSALLFAPQMGQIWFWGFVLQQTLTPFFYCAAVFSTSADTKKSVQLILPLFFSALATLSSGNGLLIWPAITTLLLLYKTPKRLVASYGALGLLTILLYSYHLPHHIQGAHVSLFHHITYIFAFIGSMFSINVPHLAIAIGFLASLLYARYALYSIQKNTPAVYKKQLLPWLFIGTLAIGSALLGSISRAGLGGVGQALADRYLPLSAPFWCALLGLIAYFYQQQHKYKKFILLSSLLAITCYLGSTITGPLGSKSIQQALLTSVQALKHRVYIVNPSNKSGLLNPNRTGVLNGLNFLEQHQLALFTNATKHAPLGQPLTSLGDPILKTKPVGQFSQLITQQTAINTQHYHFNKGLAAYGRLYIPTQNNNLIIIADQHNRIVGLGRTYSEPTLLFAEVVTSPKLWRWMKIGSLHLTWQQFLSKHHVAKLQAILQRGVYSWSGFVDLTLAQQNKRPVKLTAYLKPSDKHVLIPLAGIQYLP